VTTLRHASFAVAVARLETSITRLLVVAAVQQGKRENIRELFEKEGERLSATSDEWHAWFAILYVKKPSKDPRFAPYFAPGWADAVIVSAHNFLSEVMHSMPLPAVLTFGEERRRRTTAENDTRALEAEVGRLRGLLESREGELAEMGARCAASQKEAAEAKEEARAEAKAAKAAMKTAMEAVEATMLSPAAAAAAAPTAAASSSSPSTTPTGLLHRQLSRGGSGNNGGGGGVDAAAGTAVRENGEESASLRGDGEASPAGDDEANVAAAARVDGLYSNADSVGVAAAAAAGGDDDCDGYAVESSAATTDAAAGEGGGGAEPPPSPPPPQQQQQQRDANNGGGSRSGDGVSTSGGGGGSGVSTSAGGGAMSVDILRRDMFAWHTASITQCRFSADGANIASGSADGTVRIWSPDPSGADSSRNATIYCGTEVGLAFFTTLFCSENTQYLRQPVCSM
jgi:ribosomal protein S20